MVSQRLSPETMSHVTSLSSQEIVNFTLESTNIQSSTNINGYSNHAESTLRNQVNVAESNSIQSLPEVNSHSTRSSDASKEVGKSCSLTSKKSSFANGVECGSFVESFAEERLGFSEKWKRVLWKACVDLVTLGMLISLLMGLNMSWTAITAALALVVLDFKDARPRLEKVPYSPLIFFCGIFITVDGFNKTGIPSTLWEFMEPYAKIDHIGGTAVLAAVIVVLSNLASNVPTVLLRGAQVAASAAAISPASENKAWFILAWVSTVAGNLSRLGSAANLIACEQARRCQHYGYNLSFWRHLKFGVPSTLIITAIGLTLIRG